MLHQFMIVIGNDPLQEAGGLPPLDQTHIELFWAEDEEHALEQALDAHREDAGVPYLTGMVPDDYVVQPEAARNLAAERKEP